MEGRKDDQGKPRFELIPPEPLFAVAHVLTFGAEKYADRNWEQGMDWGRVFGALMRHLWAWWGGKGPTTKSFLFDDQDYETEYSHLWHALCCVMFLVAYEERGVGKDTRLGSSDDVDQDDKTDDDGADVIFVDDGSSTLRKRYSGAVDNWGLPAGTFMECVDDGGTKDRSVYVGNGSPIQETASGDLTLNGYRSPAGTYVVMS